MTLFFPDVNVWLALSVAAHAHRNIAWEWLNQVPPEARLIFGRYTHLGLLRLLTNPAVMGEQTLTLRTAWAIYEDWLSDARVEFYPEPPDLHTDFRQATMPVDAGPASKWVGDCYLLAFAKGCGAALVTFDRPLAGFAKKHGFKVIVPG